MVSLHIHSIHTKHQHRPQHLVQHQRLAQHLSFHIHSIRMVCSIHMVYIHIHNIHNKHQHQPLVQQQHLRLAQHLSFHNIHSIRMVCSIRNVSVHIHSIHSKHAGWNKYIKWCNCTSFGRSFFLVAQNDVANFTQIFICENKSNISDNTRQQLLQLRIFIQLSSDSFPHHSIFSHEYFSFASQSNSNLLHLLRSNIVSRNNEACWKFFDQGLDALEVVCFPSSPVFPNHFV